MIRLVRCVLVAAIVLSAGIALASAARGQVGVSSLWTVRGDGSERQGLTVIPSGGVLGRARDPVALSPPHGPLLARLRGTRRVLLPDTKGVIGSAALSPSGESVAFTAWSNGSYGLRVAHSDGTAVRRVEASASLAAWSRDGT